jgi:molybdopterin-binding protein
LEALNRIELPGRNVDLLKLNDAARELGVSYPTIKQWIYHHKIKSVRTPGGHHRIPRAEIDRLVFFGEAGKDSKKKPSPALKLPKGLEHFISGRNQLIGRVTKVKIVGLMAKVALDIGGQTITAIITSDACRDLGLRIGQPAAALIKATEVMIIAPGSETS